MNITKHINTKVSQVLEPANKNINIIYKKYGMIKYNIHVTIYKYIKKYKT